MVPGGEGFANEENAKMQAPAGAGAFSHSNSGNRSAAVELAFGHIDVGGDHDGLDDGLGADEDAGFAEEVETFDMDGPAVELGDDDGEVFGLAEGVLLVGDQAVLLFGEAEEFGDGVIEEGFGDVLFVEGQVILEMGADDLLVLLIALAGEAFDKAAVGEGFGGEAGEFGDGFAAAGDGDEVAAAAEDAHGKIQAAEGADATGVDGEKFRMEAPIVNKDR
jgi:hypothetical protein